MKQCIYTGAGDLLISAKYKGSTSVFTVTSPFRRDAVVGLYVLLALDPSAAEWRRRRQPESSGAADLPLLHYGAATHRSASSLRRVMLPHLLA